MDQKHAMLYPPIAPEANALAQASAAIGLPTEAPPSYDMAMAAEPGSSGANVGGWMPSAPTVSPAIVLQPGFVTEPEQPRRQQPPYPPPHQQQLPAIATTTPLPPKLGPNPCAVTCPTCGTCKTSRMAYTPNSRTHLCALLLCLVGWCCCACCVPYCMNSCRTGNHYCAKCNTFLGAFNPRDAK